MLVGREKIFKLLVLIGERQLQINLVRILREKNISGE
jgi:hypothetical protein